MEIPIEILYRFYSNPRELQNQDFIKKNYYIIVRSSSLFTEIFTSKEFASLKILINGLGELSNSERCLSEPLTDYYHFAISRKNQILFKCVGYIAIGFIHYKIRDNFYYPNPFFDEKPVNIIDFFISRNYRRMNHGKELFDQVISTTHIEPISMDFKYPNKAMKNFLEKNYGIMISITHVDNFNKIDYYDLINKQFNEFVDKYYAFNNYYNYNNFNPFNNCYNRLYESNSKPKNRFYLNNNNKNNINDSGEMNNKKYDNIENNYIKGFNTDKNNYFINNINKDNEKPKLLRNNSCFDSNRNKDNNNHYLNDENRHMANILNPNINNPNNNMVSRNKYEENNFKHWPTSNISPNNIILNYDKEEQQKNYKINRVLEDTFIQGEKTKYELRKEKIRHPEKFIDTSQALKMEEKDQGIFALGLISKNLENLGIENAIMKDSNPNEENKNFNSIQLLINGMTHKKKYDLHFDFGKERNKELLKNKNEYKKFEEKLKSKICNDFKIPSDKIVIALSKKKRFPCTINISK